MDSQALLGMARLLVEAYSPSGEERPALLAAEHLLQGAGFQVLRQPVTSQERYNLFAACGEPRAVLTTHLDTSPGRLPVFVEDGMLHGRGACDAKGIAAAMIAAARTLKERGLTGFGLLFVVGQETSSDGAVAADALVASGQLGWPCRFALLGEPTDNRFVTAHPGVVLATLRTYGTAASAEAEDEPESAIDQMLDWLHALRSEKWPKDATFGATRFHVGRLAGGTASNVVAEDAAADVMFRSGATPEALEKRVRALAPPDAEVEVTCACAPTRFERFPVAPSKPEPENDASFATDAPFLRSLGAQWLCGPGGIEASHSDEECIALDALVKAHDRYVAWTEAVLAL